MTLAKIIEKLKHYQNIEQRMKKGKGVKRFNQKDAVEYLRGL